MAEIVTIKNNNKNYVPDNSLAFYLYLFHFTLCSNIPKILSAEE